MMRTFSQKNIYDGGMKYQIIIKSKNGRDILSINSAEQEVLFKRGSAFFVIDRVGNISGGNINGI